MKFGLLTYHVDQESSIGIQEIIFSIKKKYCSTNSNDITFCSYKSGPPKIHTPSNKLTTKCLSIQHCYNAINNLITSFCFHQQYAPFTISHTINPLTRLRVPDTNLDLDLTILFFFPRVRISRRSWKQDCFQVWFDRSHLFRPCVPVCKQPVPSFLLYPARLRQSFEQVGATIRLDRGVTSLVPAAFGSIIY